MRTASEDWRKTIQDLLANECACVCVGGGVTSIDKSVFFWTQQRFVYGYGGKCRGPNSPNLDKGILKAIEIRDYRYKKSVGDHRYTRRRPVNSRE